VVHVRITCLHTFEVACGVMRPWATRGAGLLSNPVGELRGTVIRKRLIGTLDWVYTSSLITSVNAGFGPCVC
jgi:hypothetical protein